MRGVCSDPGISHEHVLRLLDYDPVTGIFTWRESGHGKRRAGAVAGSVGKFGYREITFRLEAGHRIRVKAHRLAFFYVNGRWPEGDIDHRNRDRDFNSITNLREATRAQNNHNSPPSISNTSGIKGVGVYKGDRWRAYATVNAKQVHLGYFPTKEQAASARADFACSHFGDFSGASP